MRIQKILSSFLLVFVFVSAGCSTSSTLKTAEEIKNATEVLLLKSSSVVTIRQTVLGQDGTAVRLLGGEEADREVILTNLNAETHVAGEKIGDTVFWLSAQQYDELIQNHKTILQLGMFDDALAKTLVISDHVQNFANVLKKDAAKISNRDDLLSITADQNFGTFDVLIDGKQETVQTIEAHNWFGRYSILANRANPIILEVSLSPVSRGSLNIFSKQKALEAFSGYHVSKIVK